MILPRPSHLLLQSSRTRCVFSALIFLPPYVQLIPHELTCVILVSPFQPDLTPYPPSYHSTLPLSSHPSTPLPTHPLIPLLLFPLISLSSAPSPPPPKHQSLITVLSYLNPRCLLFSLTSLFIPSSKFIKGYSLSVSLFSFFDFFFS